MIDTTMILVPTLLLVLGIFTNLFIVRTQKVYQFRNYITDLCYSKSIKDLDNLGVNNYESAYEWFYHKKVPSYDEMLFSFKPLKLENWFDKEDIERLLS